MPKLTVNSNLSVPFFIKQITSPLRFKACNVESNLLFQTSSTYPNAYWNLPSADYAWAMLRDAGVNLIQITGGTEGNIMKIQNSYNHPPDPNGNPVAYNDLWAENLEAILAKAASYGMKCNFHVMGSHWGTQMGIVAPVYNASPVSPYTSLSEALIVVDRLGGNNSLGKNFLADSRIGWWSPINESKINSEYAYVLDWLVPILQKIRSYGGKTSVCVYADPVEQHEVYIHSIQNVIPLIGDYVDYLQAHDYQHDVVSQWITQDPSGSIYQAMFQQFDSDFAYIQANRGSFPSDRVFITEYGCGNGTWDGLLANYPFPSGPWGALITMSQQQQADYVLAGIDAAKKNGIKGLSYHSPINMSASPHSFGFIEYNGIIDTAYNTFASAVI